MREWKHALYHTHTHTHITSASILPPSCPPTGKEVAYSDMGDGLLRALIARAAAFEEQIR